MSTPQYNYDENLSVAQNIATALYAIANGISLLIDNNHGQAKQNLEKQDKYVNEISKLIKALNEIILRFAQNQESEEDQRRTHTDKMTAEVTMAMEKISKELHVITTLIQKYFKDIDDSRHYYQN